MIKNGQTPGIVAVMGLLAVVGCEREVPHPGALQGIVEHEERHLAFEVGGRMIALRVDEGAVVTEGAVIASVDPSVQKAIHEARVHEAEAVEAQVELLEAGARSEEIRAMRARLDASKATEKQLASVLARHRALAGGPGATPEATVDEIAARHLAAIADRRAVEQQLQALRRGARSQELATAAARAAAARSAATVEAERLERFELHAPVSGVVLDVLVEQGEVVSPGAPVLVVADTAHPYADVFVPEGDMAGIGVGTQAALHVDAFDEPLSGRVEHVARRTEFTPRFLFSEGERPNLVIRIRVRIDDPEQRLSAGLPAFVHLGTGAETP